MFLPGLTERGLPLKKTFHSSWKVRIVHLIFLWPSFTTRLLLTLLI